LALTGFDLVSQQMIKETHPEYFPAFDGLRIVLAIIVAIAHSGFSIWGHAADFAVQVFFALSGWLIGGILLRSATDDLPRFYFNRAARIWLPYAVAVALLVSVSVFKDHISLKWGEFVFYYLTFVYNLFGPPQLATALEQMPLSGTGNHFWSICAEEQFYLLAPLLITMSGKFGRSILFWCLICVAALGSPFWGYYGSISLGVLAAVLRSKTGDWHTSKVAVTVLVPVVALSFIATYTAFFAYRVGAPLTAIVAVLLLAHPGPSSSLFSFLGGISFPLYLNHWIATFAVNAAISELGFQRSALSQALSVTLGVLLAAVFYICIDRAIKRNRDRYFTRFRGTALALCGFALVSIGMFGGLLILLLSN
jgi:peptidoglycan/LPS O-acetylase OafA/YrhL